MYIEVPDCSKFIVQGNPLFLWEQHLYYFTKESIWKIIKDSGIKDCKIYKYGKVKYYSIYSLPNFYKY